MKYCIQNFVEKSFPPFQINGRTQSVNVRSAQDSAASSVSYVVLAESREFLYGMAVLAQMRNSRIFFKSPTCQTIWCKVCKSGNWRQSLLKPCCKRCEVVDSDADSEYTDSLAEDLSLSSSLVDEEADQGETFDGNLLLSRMQTHNLPKKMGKSNFDHLFRQGKSDEEFSL